MIDALKFSVSNLEATSSVLVREYHRGVFSRQTLVLIGFFLFGAALGAHHREIVVVALSLVTAVFMIYAVIRADYRWRDRS